MAKITITEERFNTLLEEYRQKFNVDTLDTPNDLANLHLMIRNQILIEKLQKKMDEISAVRAEELDPAQIKKVLDSIVALSEINLATEKTLGIDRKTRKQDASESVPDYINGLKARAKEWLDNDERLTKVFCKHCQIMVGRISGVYQTTSFDAGFQCPQCKKYTVIKRVERDIFFDVKDADWRRKYPIEIKQAKRTNAPDTHTVENELYLGDIASEEE